MRVLVWHMFSQLQMQENLLIMVSAHYHAYYGANFAQNHSDLSGRRDLNMESKPMPSLAAGSLTLSLSKAGIVPSGAWPLFDLGMQSGWVEYMGKTR